jgi:DMSO/TMAO reductase YedYZ molybdopterin-dependent catalytic subunit
MTPTNPRGLLATRNAVPGMETSVGTVFRGRAERKVVEAGYDPARLPPGQYLTEKWPVLHAGTVPETDLSTWDFFVEGEVDSPIRLSWAELDALPKIEVTQDIHCVTRWSRFDATFGGVHWSTLKERVGQRPSARFVIAHSEQGYTANVPIEFLEHPQALLATHADGEPLTPEHGWPLRLVIPGKYFWKSAKWLRGLELSAVDKPGFWERYGYHNDADPFEEERYGF